MKIKNTNWTRKSSTEYVRDGVHIKRIKLINGIFWLAFIGKIPIHIDISEKECEKALLLEKEHTLFIDGKFYDEYRNRWDNVLCYEYGFRKILKDVCLLDLGIKIRHTNSRGKSLYTVKTPKKVIRIYSKKELFEYIESLGSEESEDLKEYNLHKK